MIVGYEGAEPLEPVLDASIKVYVWAALDEECPDKFIARIRMPMAGAGGPGRKVGLGWLPVFFSGPTEDAARQAATTHWTDAVSKERGKKPRGRPKATMEAAPGTPEIADIEETV